MGKGEAFKAFDVGQVDAVEDHVELCGGQCDAAAIGLWRGEVVAAGLQPLAPQAQTMAAPVEDLEAVG